MPSPKDKEDVQRCLGMFTYLSPYIPYLSEKSAPLLELLHKKIPFVWDEDHEHEVLMGLSFMYLSSGLSFCRIRRTSSTMEGFCLLYLLVILLMRSGDIETNPGPDRIVSEKEFLKLSKRIEPSYYKEVGINLDLPIAELGQIEKDSQNTSDALMTVFTRWRDKQPPGTDIRALFAEELESSGLGSLSGELLAGSLALKQTGENKKEIMLAARKKAFTAIDNILLLQAANKH
eukprot:XP_011670880.1 PREDICTED: uncharacterized protein LOC105441463 [Strongylocentrotus purpuratus]